MDGIEEVLEEKGYMEQSDDNFIPSSFSDDRDIVKRVFELVLGEIDDSSLRPIQDELESGNYGAENIEYLGDDKIGFELSFENQSDIRTKAKIGENRENAEIYYVNTDIEPFKVKPNHTLEKDNQTYKERFEPRKQ